MMLAMTSRVLRTRYTRRLSVAVLFATALTSTSASASSIQLIGEATGCFGSGCATFTDIASDSTFGLTFDGVSPFALTTDDSEVLSVLLGTFTRDSINVSSDLAPLPFTLQLAFSSPTAQNGIFVASITGWSPGGGGPLTVDFNPGWQTLSFAGENGEETIDFRVVNDRWVTKNGDSRLIGEIRNTAAAFPGGFDADVVGENRVIPTPEPTTLILFGSGLAFTAWGARRANTRR